MKELNILKEKIENRLQEIRNIGIERKQTSKELDEYQMLQNKLRQIYNVMVWLKESE